MKNVKFNLNHKVRFKINDSGRELHRQHFERLGMSDIYERDYKQSISGDSEGWITWPLWEVMHIFGDSCYMGSPVPIETVIELLVPEDGEL